MKYQEHTFSMRRKLGNSIPQLLELLLVAVCHALAVGVVGCDDRHVAKALCERVLGSEPVAGVFKADDAERQLAQFSQLDAAAPAIDVDDTILCHVLGHRDGDTRRIFAQHRGNLVHRDELACRGDGSGRVVAGVLDDYVELLAQYAAVGIDLLGAQHDSAADILADSGAGTRQGKHRTNIDGVLCQHGSGSTPECREHHQGFDSEREVWR